MSAGSEGGGEFFSLGPATAERGAAVRVKICGLTRLEDARDALEASADLLGFVFVQASPRWIEPPRALAILDALRADFPPNAVRPVGVFVNEPAMSIRAIARELGLFAVQLHGDEPPEFAAALAAEGLRVVKAARVRDAASVQALEPFADCSAAFLLDAYSPAARGGTGATFDHALADPWIGRHPTLIAGGLTPENAGEVAARRAPFGLDVSSGVERSPGVKDREKVRAFVRAVRAAAAPPPPSRKPSP